MGLIGHLVEELFKDIAIHRKNRYPFQHIASSCSPYLMTWLDRGKRCESGFLRSRGLSSPRSPSIEVQSMNHSSLGGVEVFLWSTLAVCKRTWASPVNGGDGKVWRWTVEKPLGKFEKQEFLILKFPMRLSHRIGWFSVCGFINMWASFCF